MKNIVARDPLSQGFGEGVFDLVASDMGSGAPMGVLVFVVEAPDVAAEFAGGVPDFPSKTATAFKLS